MNKKEFIKKIRQITFYLPKEETEKYIEYYSEIIDDAVEDGMSEQQAVESLGTVEEISAYIKENNARNSTAVNNNINIQKDKKRLPVWAIVLIVLGFPIWFSLLSTVFSVYITLWCVIIALYAADLTIFCSGIVLLIYPFISGEFAYFMIISGAGLFLTGISIIICVGLVKLTKLYVKFTVFIVKKCINAIKEVL